jgi:hypothetical protein
VMKDRNSPLPAVHSRLSAIGDSAKISRHVMAAFPVLIAYLAICGWLWAVEARVETILPKNGFLKGWVRPDGTKLYRADNLYTYINGEAEMFMPFGFQALDTALYVKTDNPGVGIAADVYEMGSPLDAFGIYSYYRDPEAEDARVGSEGFVDESQLMFYKDRYFVRLSASGRSNPDKTFFIGCAEAIAEKISGDSSRPKEISILQVPGITPRTDRYAALSVMGYPFFKRGLTAEALIDGRLAKAFIIIAESEQAAGKSLDNYSTYLKEKGMKPETEDAKEGRALLSQDPLYKGVMVRQSGHYLIGVAGLTDPRQAAPLIERVRSRATTP